MISNNYVPEKINEYNAYLDGEKMIGVVPDIDLAEIGMKDDVLRIEFVDLQHDLAVHLDQVVRQLQRDSGLHALRPLQLTGLELLDAALLHNAQAFERIAAVLVVHGWGKNDRRCAGHRPGRDRHEGKRGRGGRYAGRTGQPHYRPV